MLLVVNRSIFLSVLIYVCSMCGYFTCRNMNKVVEDGGCIAVLLYECVAVLKKILGAC